MRVELIGSAPAWDAYCDGRPEASIYHRWVWRAVIERVFQHRPYYLAALEGGSIQGILPLFSVSSRLFGVSLISMPFFTYGGALASSAAAGRALLAEAERLGRELGVKRIELRQGAEADLPWKSATPKVTMEIPLPQSPEAYLNRLSAGRRKKIRQSMRHGWATEWGGLELLPRFYDIFATNMRNLGTPVYPQSFFAEQMRALPAQIRIMLLFDGVRPAAGAFLTSHRDTLELPWAASLPESREKASPLFLYWSIIARAIEEGFQTFDMGRCTKGSGSYEFKTHWAPVERPLHWYHWTPSGIHGVAASPESRPFRMAAEIWKHMPLAVANRLGPRVVRTLP